MKRLLLLAVMATVGFTCHAQVDPLKYYSIGTSDGKVLDVNESPFQESYFELTPYEDGNPSQAWKFVHVKDNIFRIQNQFSLLVIDNDGGGVHKALQWGLEEYNANQLWRVKINGDGSGTFVIYSESTGQYLGARDGFAVDIASDDKDTPRNWTIKEITTGVDATIARTSSDEDWENPHIIGTNKLPGHVTFIPYASLKEMREDPACLKPWEDTKSSRFLSLDGKWKFNWVKQPDERPVDFYKPSYDVSSWGEIDVPANWEPEGYGHAVYSNLCYLFMNNPPFIQPMRGLLSEKEPNPVGSYRREFNLPRNWKGKKVYIHFNGVQSAFYVWVNGEKVGYSQGSNNDSEFDITPYVKSGENMVAVEVYRWCDGSYIEDQDQVRFSGIHRDVYLVARPENQIEDIHLSSTLSDDFKSAVLKADVSVTGNGKAEVILKDNDGKIVGTSSDGSDIKVADVRTWSSERPNLYTVEINLYDSKGKLLECTSQRYGFRRVENIDGKIYVNGKSTIFKGANRHDINPKAGKVIPVDLMIEDILLFKQNNYNVVRTSHYPNNPKMLALYDYYGLYVMDEADLECHGNHAISDDPEWIEAYVDRGVRMIRRDRNHPSVIFWSLGNESGEGRCLKAEYDAMKALDGSRLIHYEGWSDIADMDSRMYPDRDGIEKLDRNGSKKPFFICEYSLSDLPGEKLKDYWDYIEKSERMIGGCYWVWDATHRADVSMFKSVYQYVKMELSKDGSFLSLKNMYNDYNLDEFYIDYEIQITGNADIIKSGTVEIPSTPARGECKVKMPFDELYYRPGRQYLLTLNIRFKEAQPWTEAGHSVAVGSFRFGDPSGN